jgi:glycine/D-amino acid oxidase-like deaminating enzyme
LGSYWKGNVPLVHQPLLILIFVQNGGHCQPILFEHPHEPAVGRFELRNFDTLRKLIDDRSIDCEFVVQPAVRAIYSRHRLDTVVRALQIIKEKSPDISSKLRLVTSPDELRSLRLPTAVGAVVTDIAARMWPYKFVSRLLEDLLAASPPSGSFNLQTLTPVRKLTPSPSSVTVHTSRGNIIARKVVLATNGYTSHLLPQFSSLIVPCRGQMSSLLPLPSISGESRLEASFGFLGEALDDYLIQRPNASGGQLMFGGGRQYGESIGVTDDSVIDKETAKYLRGMLVEAFALPDGTAAASSTTSRDSNPTSMTATHMWSGIMGFSRDDHPWVGPVPDTPNTYIAAGYTGHGMPNAWLSGKAVALMVLESLGGSDDADAAVAVAQKETGLPDSYVVSKLRIANAEELEHVDTKDWAEMQRGRRGNRKQRFASKLA